MSDVRVSLIGYPAMWRRQSWMLEELSELVDLRVEVPYQWNGKRPEENLSRIAYEAHRTMFGGKIRFHVQPGIARSINAWNPDVVISWVEPHHLGSQFINRVDASLVYFAWENLMNVPANPLLKLVDKRTYNRADALICGSADAKERAREKGFDKPIETFPQSGINTDFFRPMIVDRSEYGVDEDEDIVLYVGRLAEEKGVDYLIEAMNGVDAKLLIVGDGDQRDQLERQAATMEHVQFLGFKEYDELPALYNIADVFVLPSAGTPTWTEQFGYVMFEALSCGTPVVTTDCGSIPEVTPDFVNIVQRRDPTALRQGITTVLTEDEDRKEREWVTDHLTNEAIAHRYASTAEKLYDLS